MTSNRVALLYFVLALGCSRAATSARPPVVQNPTLAVERSEQLAEIPLAGASARFPAPARHFRSVKSNRDGTVVTVGATATSDAQEYTLGHLIRESAPRGTKLNAKALAHAWLAKVHSERPVSLAGFSGFDFAGTTQQGKAARLRIYEVGQGTVMATVVREGSALDETTARAFLDSLTIRTKWSVQAFPEGRFTALLPESGIEYGPKELEAEDYLVAYGASLGNAEDQLFAVYAVALEGEGVDPDRRLDVAAEKIVESSKLIWQQGLLYEGARSRDYLLQTDDQFQRIRLIITETHIYMLLASARSSATLLDEEVKRFFRSLTWYPER
jgi:hypothetical protein